MKIVVFCPANTATGGPEVLHQLCYCLRDLGYNSFMCYYGYNKNEYKTPVCDCYSHYENPYTVQYIDSTENVCIVPETHTKAFFKIKKGVKILWWLSVDNYTNRVNATHGHIFKNNLAKIILRKVKHLERRVYDVKKKDISFHLVQCEYAKKYCQSLKIPEKKILYLSDYLNDSYLLNAQNNITCKKENRVLFNPKKGYEFTKLLIETASDIDWVPLINLSYDEVVKLMQHSKVYIDFGNHPGKDRLPREAAVNGCCIITGKRGSAAYQEDVDIPAEFKFEDRKERMSEIIQKIRDVFASYDEIKMKFDGYRQKIYQEPRVFRKDIEHIFPIIETYWRNR